MSKNRFFNRIDKIDNIDTLAKLACEKYKLGNYISSKLVEVGYEDFNVTLLTSKGKYFLKVFRNSRNDKEVKDVIERACLAEQNNINSPKVFKNSDNEIFSVINYKKSRFRLAIMEYIDGISFYDLDREATIDELIKIADIGARMNKINYKPNFIYDTWAISSFIEEYEKKKSFVSKENLNIIEPIYNKFKKFDYSSLPKSFVHGDIIKTNLMIDSNNELYVIDYSVSNYTARLNEIAVICCDIAVISGNKEESEKRIKITFEEWAKKVNATNLERKSFKMLFDVANAIYLLIPAYEATTNDSEENNKCMKLGRFGLSLNIDI